jgi:hypothetical protein
MASIGSLRADLALESAAFIRDFRRAAEETRRNTTAMNRSLASLDRGLSRVVAAGKTFVAGYLGVQGIRAMVGFATRAVQTRSRRRRLRSASPARSCSASASRRSRPMSASSSLTRR